MKKRIGLWISIFLFFILLHLLSGVIHSRAESLLGKKLVGMMPEGSSIGNIEWDILSSLKADSVVVGGLGVLSEVRVFYTPLGVLRRRVKNLSLKGARLNLSFSGSTKGRERSIPGLFYIEDFSVLGGCIQWEGREFLLNGKGRFFSTGDKLVLDVFKVSGSMDTLVFNITNGQLFIERLGSLIDMRELRIGHSKLRLSGDIGKRIEGKGRIYLRDLKTLFDIEGEGLVEVEFAYDSVLQFKGKSGSTSIEGFNLTPLEFQGTTDSIVINGPLFAGFLKVKDKMISGDFKLNGLNMKGFKEGLPESKLSGKVIFTYSGSENFKVKSAIQGTVEGAYLRDFNLDFEKMGERVIIDELEGYINGGRICFSGEYGALLKGDLEISGVEISPLLKYLGINGRALTYVDLNFQDKVYGVFSFDSLQYGSISIGLIDGNVNLLQKDGKFLGELTFVTQELLLKKNKIFEIGEGVVKLARQDMDFSGFVKSGEKQLDYSLRYFKDSLKLQELKIAYPGGWLMLDSPFSALLDKGIQIEEAKFKGNKSEKVGVFLDISDGDLAGRVKFDGFNLHVLEAFGLIDLPVSGVVDGLVTLSGKINKPAMSLDGNGRISWKGMGIGDSLNIELGYRDGSISLNDIVIFEGKKASRFRGSIDLLRNSLYVKADFDSAGRWIFYPLYEHIDARRVAVNGSVKLKGPLLALEIYGGVDILKGSLLLVGPGIEIENIAANIEFDGSRALLKSSCISMSEGVIDAKGVMNVRERSFDVKVNVDKTPLNWQYVNALIDADLTVSKKEEKLRIEGDVDLNKTTITMPFQKKGNGGTKLPNLFLNIKFDASRGNVWIRNDMADMELKGGVGVWYDGGALLLSGDLSVKQGNFYYFYRSFDVIKGEFEFRNSPELNPSIDIKAKTIVQEEDTVFLDVSGTMRTPQFELYSKPARATADIMALLNLNLSWEDFSSLKAIEESVTETAFNYWVRQTFTKRFKERFGIDLIEMRGKGGHYEMIFGQYITEKLFVKARADILSYGISEIEAEYRFRRWGSIIAANNPEGETRLLFKFRWRY